MYSFTEIFNYILAFIVCTDNLKEVVVAKLAAQCSDLYAEALKLMQKEMPRQLWDRDWLPTVSICF